MVKNIRDTVNIDEMQFGFCPVGVIADRQLQERCLTKHGKLYMAFVDLERPSIECLERYRDRLFVSLLYRNG